MAGAGRRLDLAGPQAHGAERVRSCPTCIRDLPRLCPVTAGAGHPAPCTKPYELYGTAVRCWQRGGCVQGDAEPQAAFRPRGGPRVPDLPCSCVLHPRSSRKQGDEEADRGGAGARLRWPRPGTAVACVWPLGLLGGPCWRLQLRRCGACCGVELCKGLGPCSADGWDEDAVL